MDKDINRIAANHGITVTIGFPVYNVEQFVEKSLLSALNQDFSYDYEIIVVDDCGKDHSMRIVNNIKECHPKGHIINIIRQTQNKGVAEARNAVIRQAAGKYIFFLDSDDYISKGCLTTLYNLSGGRHSCRLFLISIFARRNNKTIPI